MKKQKFTFEEIYEQNERRIHYHLHRLNIRDHHQEFYQEGLIAMWSAYKNYQPDKGPLSTYFNYMIRNRLIDLIRKESRRLENEKLATSEDEGANDTATYHQVSETTQSHITTHLDSNMDDYMWKQIRNILTEKQWKWVRYYIIEDMTLKEIAENEGVSIEAVKSWAKEAKKKLRNIDMKKMITENLNS
ncbi:sigma-70 family RNA polymerase sigma factor [Oceanobacillus luteolus]|uniref:Sigma-70 family RNA polymerase sigma factor n=1 Tax=Oceanobacillus luteolus TaxID=1274358 RepID=A0ABW4HYG8_9BACI|nr:sigma-70 family RNA polymerase sigma factor [Oceanobacillus luteolus]MCM3739757.1 sigma-70 family RNA polymerase sigma factor [Oceanobacillus luteolus]